MPKLEPVDRLVRDLPEARANPEGIENALLLGRGFADLAERLNQRADQAAVAAGTREGVRAGEQADFRPTRELTLRAQARDRAGLAVYLSNLEIQTTAEIDRLAKEHAEDPLTMQKKLDALGGAVESGLFDEARQPFRELFARRSRAALIEADRAFTDKKLAEARLAVREMEASSLDEIHRLAFALGANHADDDVRATFSADLAGALTLYEAKLRDSDAPDAEIAGKLREARALASTTMIQAQYRAIDEPEELRRLAEQYEGDIESGRDLGAPPAQIVKLVDAMRARAQDIEDAAGTVDKQRVEALQGQLFDKVLDFRTNPDVTREGAQALMDEIDAARDGTETAPGYISAEKADSLKSGILDRVEKVRELGVSRAKAAAAVAGAIALDPKSPDDRRGWSDYFERVLMPNEIAQLPPDQQNLRIARLIGRTGIVPDLIRNQVRGLLRSGDAEQVLQAADAIDLIGRENPRALQDFAKEDLRLAELTNLYVRAGAEPLRAVERAKETLFASDAATREERERALRAGAMERDNTNRSELQAMLADRDGRLPFFSARTEGFPASDTLHGEFNALVEAEFLATGDIDVARKIAFDDLMRTWGVTKIDGKARWMKFAPEAVYHVEGVSDAWMREQLLRDISKTPALTDPTLGDLDERVRLQPLPRTIDTGAGLQPQYLVMLKNEHGAYEPMMAAPGDPFVWRPDWNASAEAKRRARKQQEQLEAARARRTAKRNLAEAMAAGTMGGRL